MSSVKYRWLIVCCLLLTSACSTRTNSQTPTVAIPTAAPYTSAGITTSGEEVSKTLSLGQYLLIRIPQCEALEVLDQPLKFDWPNIEERIKEIGGALWGYYSCEQTQGDVAAFYREHTPEPPYNHEEVNWVEREQGDVGVYYNTAASVWMYVWIVPQPGDPSKTFVIVAESFEPIKGGC